MSEKTPAVQKRRKKVALFSIMEETLCLDIGDAHPLSVAWMDGWPGERRADG